MGTSGSIGSSGSSRSDRTNVKAARAARPPGSIARHLEGWQPGLLALFVAGMSAALAVPRPVAPVEIPEPVLDPGGLDQAAQGDRALAGAADWDGLDADVRALSEALRAYGRAEVEGEHFGARAEGTAVMRARREVAEAAKLASAQGMDGLARLRAYQLRSFQRELRRWERSGEASDELLELGGPFLDDARQRGWIEGGRLLIDAPVRAALFKKRWSELTLAHGPAFDLTPAETRALYRFLLLHPPREAPRGLARSGAAVAAADERAAHLAGEYRLRKIDELRTIDPSYPTDLGKGVVLYRMHRYAAAAEAFERHLEQHPDGPWALRATNYLRAALEAR